MPILKQISSWIPLPLKIEVHHGCQRFRAVWTSLRPLPEPRQVSIARYAGYVDLKKTAGALDRPGLKVIELGGSNGVFRDFFPQADYRVAPNYPEVDIQDLSHLDNDSYDVVLLDQVLEHVEKPQAAVGEIHRILRPGGTLIGTTPFLIYVHPCPRDYWRFTEDGLRVLLKIFSRVEIKSWGNQVALEFVCLHGAVAPITTARRVLRLLWDNEPNFPLLYWFVANK